MKSPRSHYLNALRRRDYRDKRFLAQPYWGEEYWGCECVCVSVCARLLTQALGCQSLTWLGWMEQLKETVLWRIKATGAGFVLCFWLTVSEAMASEMSSV